MEALSIIWVEPRSAWFFLLQNAVIVNPLEDFIPSPTGGSTDLDGWMQVALRNQPSNGPHA